MAQIVLMIGNHQLCGGRRELPDDYLKVKSHIRLYHMVEGSVGSGEWSVIRYVEVRWRLYCPGSVATTIV